jgi:hypothetical protein
VSLEIQTFVPSLDDSLKPLWISELNKLGMRVEMHPDIALTTHSGFLPFKIRIEDSAHEKLNGVDFLTGFEYYVDEFSLDAELAKHVARPQDNSERQDVFATPEIDKKLKDCRKVITFAWGSEDLFELRMATVSSAILAAITGGASAYPADGIWYERPAAEALGEAREYENSRKPKAIKVHPFQGWR